MIDTLFSSLDEKISDCDYWKKEIKELNKDKKEQQKLLKDLIKARNIFQVAAKLTQQQLSEKISLIVSNALNAVFFDPYNFLIDFVERRNTTECDLLFEKNGNKRDPLSSCGFGAADIASLALRVAYWKLQDDSRNVLILDEPTRALSKEKQKYASMMLKSLSQIGEGLQFIIVTHNKDLADSADKVFRITQENGISNIQTIKGEKLCLKKKVKLEERNVKKVKKKVKLIKS